MPLYEYRCASCGHELEVLQKVSAPAPVDCPACQQPHLQKKLTAAGFQLKGTGWYVTDFRGGNGPTSEPPIKTEGESKPANVNQNAVTESKSESGTAGEKAQSSESASVSSSTAPVTQTSSTTHNSASA
jgi:hypothetical protein